MKPYQPQKHLTNLMTCSSTEDSSTHNFASLAWQKQFKLMLHEAWLETPKHPVN